MNAVSYALKFWHPVLSGRALPPNRVVGIKVAGSSLAVFRTGDGQLGAVTDQCAHRRMKLSVGTVQHGRLICPYHGWSFDRDGNGESPSAPKMQACVKSYGCAEASGAIWIKTGANGEKPPTLAMDGWDFAGAEFNRVCAPLELVIDNFSEVEHTVTTHPHFGFDREQASKAVVELETTEDSITVRNHGPAKMPPLDTRLAVAIRRGDRFHSNYTFRFDPPRSSVTHLWTNPRTGQERMVKYHVLHYFVPEDETTTIIVTFGFLKIRWPLVRHLGPQMGWLFRRKLRRTVEEDAFLLENLADKSPGLDGMKLSRFDPILGLTRERLRRIYYEARS
jgi:phenylpropionate dioxygenase-like ring-hydroxylating dioxygenase large terminal subunit